MVCNGLPLSIYHKRRIKLAFCFRGVPCRKESAKPLTLYVMVDKGGCKMNDIKNYIYNDRESQ